MSGLNYGLKYSYSKAVKENLKLEEGVFFSEKSHKWRVLILNKGISRKAGPIIAIAQFDDKKDAEKSFNKYKKLNK
jgi:hypothetical protein